MTERMSKDARLVDSMTGRMSKLTLTENQHQNPHRGGTGAILPDQNQVSTDPTWNTGQFRALQSGRPKHVPSNTEEPGRKYEKKNADKLMGW